MFSVQLEAFEVSVAPDLQQQLASFIQELGVQIPAPVSHLKLIRLVVKVKTEALMSSV